MSLPQSDSPPSVDIISLLPGWKKSAVVGTIAGMLFVPTFEAVTKKDFEITMNSGKTVNICNKRVQSRFARLTRSFRVGGVRGGVSMMTFWGVLSYLNEKRGIVDVHNFAASGSVAGGALALMTMPQYPPPGIRYRILSVMGLSVFAGVFSYPMGWSVLKVIEKQRVYLNDLLKQIKKEELRQCDEAHMKDQETV